MNEFVFTLHVSFTTNVISARQRHLGVHLRANVNDGAEVTDAEANEAFQCRKTERGVLVLSVVSNLQIKKIKA